MSEESFNLFVSDLTVLDCAIWDPQKGPIGMSWQVDVEFIGGLDKEGVVFDFSHAKKAAKKVIDDLVDHRLIVPKSLVSHDNRFGIPCSEPWVIDVQKPYPLYYAAPKQAYCMLDNCSENGIIAYLESEILNDIGRENVYQVNLTFKDERDFCDDEKPHRFYSYTHGLKEHYGNCQRLIHGHQSTIKVFVNGIQRKDIELAVCDLFANKHLVYKENLAVNKDVVKLTSVDDPAITSEDPDSRYCIRYESSQGKFELKIPENNVIVFPYETTVEYISKYVARWVSTHFEFTKSGTIEVHAYEGIGKGSKYVLNPEVPRRENKSAQVLLG